jgi:hypothetical protein
LVYLIVCKLYALSLCRGDLDCRRLVAEMSPLFPDLSVLVDMKGFASSYMDIADAMALIQPPRTPNSILLINDHRSV